MKGQYKIITEVLFFAIGILLTGYVIISFVGVRDFFTDAALKNQLSTVGNLVGSSVAKASQQPNSIIYVKLPSRVSGATYSVSVQGGECSKKCYLNMTSSNDVSVKVAIFNMARINNKISGYAESIDEFIEVENIEGDIVIRPSRVL